MMERHDAFEEANMGDSMASAIERALAGTHEVPVMNLLGNVFSERYDGDHIMNVAFLRTSGSTKQYAGLSNVSDHFIHPHTTHQIH